MRALSPAVVIAHGPRLTLRRPDVLQYFKIRHCNDWCRLRATTYAMLAAFLLTAPVSAAAQQKPIEIGALALGPRFVPTWRCTPAQYGPASAERRQETMPFSVLGLRDKLEKLNYVEDRPENVGKPGRHFAIDLRMGTLQDLRAYAREFVRRRVDIIVAIAAATVQVVQEEIRGSQIPILMTAVSDPVRPFAGAAGRIDYRGGPSNGAG